MFSPSVKKQSFSSRNERKKNHNLAQVQSPVTPHNLKKLDDGSMLDRPATGTPAPWSSRLSVLARISPKKGEKGDELDLIKPVYVGEFPQVVRDEQARFLQKRPPGDVCISGGMDKGTSLSWIICSGRLFIWSYLSPASLEKCIVLELPPDVLEGIGRSSNLGSSWLVSFINWDIATSRSEGLSGQQNSIGIVVCHKRSQAIVYWPDIYSDYSSTPVVSLASSEETDVLMSLHDGRSPDNLRHHSRLATGVAASSSFNSMITSPVPNTRDNSVALVCSSNGDLWKFQCSPVKILREKVALHLSSLSSHGSDSGSFAGSKGYPRSLIWRFPNISVHESTRQFFLLTNNEIQCFIVRFSPNTSVLKLWSHEIIGADGDSGIKKDLAGQKRIWPLDLQIDNHGKEITVLVATFCKDRVTSSSYTQYSVLVMQYRSGVDISSELPLPVHERVLEKKAPVQVIIPKARVEDEDFLFSMRVRVGGKPSGSIVILSGDGTATVAHYYGNSTRLYQFDLPYDAGKVLDSSVFPSTEDFEDGAWVVLTEKAGFWAIPEKAILLGGVEPPERSLSRKGSSNEGTVQEERRNVTFAGDVAPRRASSEAWDTENRRRAAVSGFARRSVQDEESEALLSQLFHEFLSSGHVDGSLDKLQKSKAFERDGETNVFARLSKSIIDTLAKHWTTTRGAEIVSMAVVSSQLIDKQQKHHRFLQFLALSKCHEELCSKQRHALQIIMEHGEKLTAMIQLRELQSMKSQNRSGVTESGYATSDSGISGSLWHLIQLAGERARQNTVLLMDRDNAEVFYSKVSDIEEVFNCLDRQLELLVSERYPPMVQAQKVNELSSACVTLVRAAIEYKNEHDIWYPSSEGLTPWYCQLVVRKGLWQLASCMLLLLKGANGPDQRSKADLFSHLEVLAEVLLESYSGAIVTKTDRREDYRGLTNEYWSRRDLLLESLYEHIKTSIQAKSKLQEVMEGTGEHNELLREHCTGLLSVAKRHEGYQTLWNVCSDLDDSGLLRNLMHESMGPKGGFSYFVFKQLHENRQFSKLLRLGEEFQEELSIFLKHHRELLWLHEVFLHQFSSASETLHSLAVSQDEKLISALEDGANPEDATPEPTLAERKRFLNLSKIAAMAGKDVKYEIKVNRIEADLKLLKLQEMITRLIDDDKEVEKPGEQLIRPEDLIKLCLKGQNPELTLRAFDVFAYTGSSFRRSNRSLLEECWKNAANQDHWGKLYLSSVTEGWTDADTLKFLRKTTLFQASSRCYGPEAEIIEGGFEEVLTLREETAEDSILRDPVPSVESILMQHKDFPEAGKLMLMAIMLGSAEIEIGEEGPIPME